MTFFLLACSFAPCDDEANDQLRTLCLVQAAADHARRSDAGGAAIPGARARCDQIADPTWKDECFFRVAESAGQAGAIAEAVAACRDAGRFASFCDTHIAWLSDYADLSTENRAAVDASPALSAAFWFATYYGTGNANPGLVKSRPASQAAYARTGWAMEAVRLTEGDIARARSAWDADETLAGGALAADSRHGRYDPAQWLDELAALPTLPMYGGATRLAGETDEEDLTIALLEAAYFYPRTSADAFVPFFADAHPRVVYTAIQRFRILPSTHAEATLTARKNDADPMVAALVADALRYRTWVGKPNRPGKQATFKK